MTTYRMEPEELSNIDQSAG